MNECLEIEYLFGFICNWYCLVLFIIFWVSDSDMYFSFNLFIFNVKLKRMIKCDKIWRNECFGGFDMK